MHVNWKLLRALGPLFLISACTTPRADDACRGAISPTTGACVAVEAPESSDSARAPDVPLLIPDAGASEVAAPDLATGEDAIGATDGAGLAIDDPFLGSDGSRLKMRWAEFGAARIFITWYDTTLRTDCRFTRATDGEYRCLPDSGVANFPLFTNPACTAVAAPAEPPGCMPELLTVRIETPPARCGGYTIGVRRRGERLPAGTHIFSRNPGTEQCGAGRVLGASEVLYAAGEELPPSMFVKGNVVAPPRPPGTPVLDFTLMEGEDGARQPWAWQNLTTKEGCNSYDAEDGSVRCVGGSMAIIFTLGWFGQADCSSQPLQRSPPGCPPLRFAAVNKPGCPAKRTLHSLGGRVAMSYGKYNDGTCRPNEPDVTADFVTLGGPGAEMGAPELKASTEATGGRLRRRLLSAPGGRSTVSSEWFDGALGEVCTPRIFASGALRCAPNNALGFLTYFYSDTGCASPVWLGPETQCMPRFAVASDATTCPTKSTYHSVGPAYFGEVYQRRISPSGAVSCTPYTVPAGSLTHAAKPIPETQFAELTVNQPK